VEFVLTPGPSGVLPPKIVIESIGPQAHHAVIPAEETVEQHRESAVYEQVIITKQRHVLSACEVEALHEIR